jgi:O-antigen/teichoic acid export membrane protein
MTTLTLVAICARFGLDVAVVREVAADWQHGKRESVARAYGEALGAALLLGVIGALLLLGSAVLARGAFADPGLVLPLHIASLTVLPLCLSGIQGGLLKAIGRPVAAALVEVCLVPACAMVAVLILHLCLGLTLSGVVCAYLLGACAACAFGAWAIGRALPARLIRRGLRRPRLRLGGFSLVGIELLNFALPAAATLLLGALAGTAEAGVYNAALRLTAQVGLIAVIVGGTLSPRFAALYRDTDAGQLVALYQRATAATSALALPLLLPMLVYPQFALLLFGDEFEAVSQPLRILAAAQLLNVLTGPCGYLLTMTGHERDLRNVLLGTAAVVLPLMAVLTATAGAIGAALAALAGALIQNLAAALLAQRRLGVSLLALPGGLRAAAPPLSTGT